MTTEKTVKTQTKKQSGRDPILLSTLAHLSILAVLLVGPFSMAIPLLIWLLERNKPDKSKVIEFHSKQAFFYQIAVYIIAAVIGILAGILSIILIGLLFIPVLILFGIAAVVYGVYGGVRVSQGQEFRYYYIADFIEA